MRSGVSPSASAPERGVPLIVFHGDRDRVVDHVNADALVDHALHSVIGTGGWASTIATTHEQLSAGGRAYTRVVHGHGDRSLVEQWTVHQAGHAWSGGSRHGSYADPLGPDATGEFVRFFEEHVGGPR